MTAAVRYGAPRRIWVEDGEVLAEGHDGAVLIMTPEVALELSRKLGVAGSESLINRVMEERAQLDDQ